MKKLLVGVALTAVASTPAFAAIDVSAATTAITTDGTAAVTSIGQALIGLAGVAVVFKWAKGSIFG
ncbi:major capsid protein [Vibrio clamense]|uniref:major capsid protein n=1 Tax=Vibrio TaxID=662 RepID=UPI001493C073|nr:major capsid protein [Vibrio sp. 03-59-1]NOH83720.1 hypothetical protein [Vibrio sp. 03-59-1]